MNKTFTDSLGNEIFLGNRVVICPRNEMKLGIVTKFNPKSVRVTTMKTSIWWDKEDIERIDWEELEGNLNFDYIKHNPNKVEHHTINSYFIKEDSLKDVPATKKFYLIGKVLKSVR